MDDVDRILARAGVRFAYLFGSRASGTARPESDADIAIMPGRELRLLERERLARELAEELEVPDVDLVLLDRVRLELRGRVVQEGRLIYQPMSLGASTSTSARYPRSRLPAHAA